MTLNLADNLNAYLFKQQREYLEDAQKTFGFGPKQMAAVLEVNYNTYKAWLYGKNPMPNVVRVALNCLMRNKPEGSVEDENT